MKHPMWGVGLSAEAINRPCIHLQVIVNSFTIWTWFGCCSQAVCIQPYFITFVRSCSFMLVMMFNRAVAPVTASRFIISLHTQQVKRLDKVAKDGRTTPTSSHLKPPPSYDKTRSLSTTPTQPLLTQLTHTNMSCW